MLENRLPRLNAAVWAQCKGTDEKSYFIDRPYNHASCLFGRPKWEKSNWQFGLLCTWDPLNRSPNERITTFVRNVLALNKESLCKVGVACRKKLSFENLILKEFGPQEFLLQGEINFMI